MPEGAERYSKVAKYAYHLYRVSGHESWRIEAVDNLITGLKRFDEFKAIAQPENVFYSYKLIGFLIDNLASIHKNDLRTNLFLIKKGCEARDYCVDHMMERINDLQSREKDAALYDTALFKRSEGNLASRAFELSRRRKWLMHSKRAYREAIEICSQIRDSYPDKRTLMKEAHYSLKYMRNNAKPLRRSYR